MIEFRIRLWNKDGEFVSDAMMGTHSLATEIDNLPIGWRLEVVRTAREPNANVIRMPSYSSKGR